LSHFTCGSGELAGCRKTFHQVTLGHQVLLDHGMHFAEAVYRRGLVELGKIFFPLCHVAIIPQTQPIASVFLKFFEIFPLSCGFAPSRINILLYIVVSKKNQTFFEKMVKIVCQILKQCL